MSHSPIRYHALLAFALVIGALLRLAANGAPFSSNDHAELAGIVTYFYPRGAESLGGGSPNIWQMLTSVHGALPPLLGMVSMTLVGLAGVAISEWWWNLPFVLVGLATILTGARLAEDLAGRRAGAIAALLLALLPIHAATSRASGLGHITLMGLGQLLALWAFVRYYERPTAARARLASLALCLDLLVELFFPVLLALLFVVGLLAGPPPPDRAPHKALHIYRRPARQRAGYGLRRPPTRPQPGRAGGLRKREPATSVAGRVLRERLAATRQRLAARQVLLAPLIVIIVNGLIMVGYAAGYLPQGGTFSRLFQGSDRQPGLFVGAFWSNASFVAGAAGFVLLAGLGLLGLPALWRLDRRAAPLLWAAAYLLPFIVFTRANFAGYLLMGSVGLTINAAIVLADLWERGAVARLASGLLVPALAAAMALQSLGIIFGLGPLAGPIAQGGVQHDQGLKAAAWWVRGNSDRQALVFADGSLEPYQIWYYLRRPAIALTDAASPETAYQALAASPRRPQLYLLPPANTDLLFASVEGKPQLLLTVADQGQPLLLVYGYGGGPPQQLELAEGNRRFDQELGHFAAMFSLRGAP